MSLIPDEILNKYLDGELTPEKVQEVKVILKRSEPDRKRFKALKLVHDNLFSIREDKVSEDFTFHLMKKLNRKFVLPKQQKYFIILVSSFIVLICLGIVGYLIATILSAPTPQAEPVQVTETVQRVTTGLITEMQKLFSGNGVSIIGSIISFAMIITGYIFFERQKQLKARLGS